MKRSTKRKILIMTLKSIRVVAWAVATVFGALGCLLIIAEAPESLGAGTEFFLTTIANTLMGIGMLLVASGSGWVASKISQLFKECGIK